MKKSITAICLLFFIFSVERLVLAVEKTIAQAENEKILQTNTDGKNIQPTKKSKIKIYRVSGDISSVDTENKTITLKFKRGEVLLLIDDKTTMPIEWKDKSLPEINIGTKVIAMYTKVDDKNIAKSIKVVVEEDKKIPEPTMSINQEFPHAKSFFIDCVEAFKFKEFSTLVDFLNRHPNDPRPDSCFRLNNNEFLVIITDAGTVDHGLHYIATKEDKMVKESGGLMGVAQEFLGKNKKRYVLLGWGSPGAYGYSILNLIPKTNGKSYTEYNLIRVYEDPVSGYCGERKEYFIRNNQNAADITSYKILNEGSEDVTIVFDITEENCKSSKKNKYTKKFKLVDGIFKLIE